MPSLAVSQYLFQLMRHCFLGRWICLPVSERFRLVWRCHLFDYSTYIPFCVHWHGGQCLRRLVPNYAVVFRLGWVFWPIFSSKSIWSKDGAKQLLPLLVRVDQGVKVVKVTSHYEVLLSASLYSCHLAFLKALFWKSKWCCYTIAETWLQLGRIPIRFY